MKTQIKLNENLILKYRNGKLYQIEYPKNNMLLDIYEEGDREWTKGGKLHRDNNLPAVIYASGYTEYWRHGKRIKQK